MDDKTEDALTAASLSRIQINQVKPNRLLGEIIQDLSKRVPEHLLSKVPPKWFEAQKEARDREARECRKRHYPLDLLPYDVPHKYIPWYNAVRVLNHYAPGWIGEIRNIAVPGKTTNTFVTVVYRITLKGSDGEVCREASATSTMDYSDHSVYFSPVQNAERSHRRNGSLDNTGSDDDVSTEDIDDTVSVESGSSKSSASVEIGYRAPDLVMRWNEEASDEFDYHLRSERYNLGRAKRRKVRHPKSVESLENNNEVSDEDGSSYELFGQLENIESILHSSISSQMQPSTFDPLKTLQMPFVQPLSPGDTWVPSTFPRLTPSQLTAHAKHCKKLKKQVVQSLKSKHAINASKKEKKIKDQMTYASTLLNTTSGTLCLESSGVISSNLDSKEAMLAPSTKFIAEEALFDSDEGDMRGSKKTKAETARQTRSLRVVTKVGEHSHLLFMEKRRKKEALEFQNVENMPSSSGPVQRNTKANISKVKTTRHKNRQSMKDRKFKISNQQRSGNRFLLENEYETVDELILSSEASDTGLETNVLGLKGDKSRKQKIMHRQETAHHTEDNAQNYIKKEKRKVFVDDEDYHSARDSTPSSRGSEIEPESIQKSFVTRVQHDAEVLGDIEFIDGSLETAGVMIGKEEEIVRGFLIEKGKLQSKSSKMVRSTQKKKVQPHIKGPKGNKARHPKSNFLSESSRKQSSPADKPLETEIILPTSDTMISIQVESYEDKSRFKVQQSTQVNESSLRTIVPKLRSVQSTKLKRSAIDNKDKSSLKSTSSEVKRVIRADATTRNLEMGKKRMNRMHKEASRRVVIAPYEKKISFLNPISESLGELTTLAYHDEYTSENWKDVDSRMERKFQEGEREHVVESQWRAKQKRMARLAAVSRKKESFSNIKNKSPQKLETTREDTKKYERHQLPRGTSKQKVMKKLAICHNSDFVDKAPSLSEDPEAYQKNMQPSKQLQILKPKVIRALQSYGEIEMASHERKTVLTNDLSSIIQESSTSSIEGYETDADEPLRKIPKRYISQDGMQLLEKAGTSRETVINKIQDATPLYSVSKVARYSFENHETAIASSSKNSMLIKSRRRRGTQLHEKICEPMNSVLHKENMKLSVHDGLEISEELTIDQRRDGSAKMEDSKIERSKQEADEYLKLSESEKIIWQKEGKTSVTDHTLDKGKSTQEKIDKSLMKTPQLHKLSSYEQGSKSSLASDLHIGTYLDRKSNDEVHATKRHSKGIRKIKKMQDHQLIAKGSTSSNENETFATSLDVKMSISGQEQEGSILMKTLKLGGHSQEQGDYIVVDSFETDRESRYYGKESKRKVDKIREISTVETDMTSEHKSTDPENQIKILAHKSMFVGEIPSFSEDFGAKVDVISELGSSTAIMESSKIGQFSIDVLAPKREKKEDINVISLSDEQLDTDKTNISSREETEIKEDAILQGMNHEDIIQMERCLVIARDNITNDMSSKDTPSTSSAKAGDFSKDESSSFKADIIESVKHDTSKSDMDGGPITSSTMDVRIVTSTSTFSSEYASCAAEIFPPMNENKETSQKQKIRRNSEISFGNEPSFSLKASTTEEKAIASPTVDARTIKAVSNLSSQISTPGAKVYLPDNATPEYDQMKEILKSPEISIVYGPSSTVRSWNLEKEPVIAGGTVETSITTIVETDMGQVIATINDQSHQGETFEVDNDETRFFNSTKNKRTVDSEMRFTSNFTTSVPICHSREGEYQPFDEKEIVSDPKVFTMDEFSVSSQSYITEMPLKSEVDDDEQRVIVSSSESSSHFATPVGEVHSPWDASSESDHMEGALKTSQLLTVDQPSTDLRNSIMEGVMPLTSEEEVDNRHFIDLAMDMSTTPSSSTSSSPKITIDSTIDMKTIALESISEPRFSNAVTKFDQAESCGLGCEIIMVKHETHGIYSSLRNNMDTGVTSRSARGEDDGKRETISMISMGSVALATTSTSNSVRSFQQAPKSQESSPEKKIESVSRFHTMQKVPTGLKRSSIAKAAVRTLRLESDIGQGRTMDMKTNLIGTTSTQNIASPTPKVHQVRTSVASKVRPWSVGGETTVRRRSPILDKYSTERQRSNSSPKKSVARVLKSHHKYDSSFSLKKQTSGRSTGWTKERVTKLTMSNETNETTTTSSLKSHSHRKKDDLQISLDQESGCEKTVIKSSEITLIHGASSSKKNSFARRVKPWPKNEMVKVPRYKTYDRGVPLSRSEIETECGASLDSVPSGQMPAEMLGYDSSGLRKLTPLTLGLETEGGVMTIIIPRNSSLPIRRRQLISTHIDNQTELLLHIFEGERFWVRDNEMLGSFEIKEIVPAPRGEPLITVHFDIDTKGILNVFVEGEKTVGRRTMKALAISNVSVRPNTEKILEMILDAKNHKVEDDENRRRIEVKDTLENYVYKMRNIINDERIARFLDPRDKKEMMTAVNDALNWVRKSNWVLYDQKQIAEFHEVDAQRRKVQSICNPILERLFLGESHVRNIQNLPPTDH